MRTKKSWNVGLGLLLGASFLVSSNNLIRTVKDRYLLLLLQQLPQQSAAVEENQLVRLMEQERDDNSINSTISSTSAESSSSLPTLPPLCTREQIRKGQWYPVHLEKPPFITQDQIGRKKNLLCKGVTALSSQQKQQHQHTQREGISLTGGWNTWEWKPNDAAVGGEESPKCHFTTQSWDTTTTTDQFCQLLANQTLLLMGDSLTQEHYFHLAHLLGLPISAKNYVDHQETCNGTVRLIHRRDDYFQPSKLREELQQHNNPSVVVINRGAHYVNDTELLWNVNEYITDLQQWQNNCTRQEKQCMVVWRTTVPGHGSCQKYHEPTTTTNNLTHMEELLVKTPQGRLGSRFHWGDFQHQNQLVEAAFSGLENYYMLDAYDINMIRPDSHRAANDCLHSCLGSKQLIYTQIILHYWKLLQQQQHQQQQ